MLTTPKPDKSHLDLELRKRNLRPEDRARLIQDLLKAGVPAPVGASTSAGRPPGGS